MLLSVLHGLFPLRSDRTVPSSFFFLSTPLLLAELRMPERNLGWLQVKSCEGAGGHLPRYKKGGHLDSVTSTCCCGMPPARWIKIEILIQPPAFSRGGYSDILIILWLLLGDFWLHIDQSHWRPLKTKRCFWRRRAKFSQYSKSRINKAKCGKKRTDVG